MARKPSRAKSVPFELVVPEGAAEPKVNHVRQVRRLLTQFDSMGQESQDMFCRSLLNDDGCLAGNVFDIVTKLLASNSEWLLKSSKYARRLEAALLKHRKPVRNAERDAEIMRLHGEKKTAGQIVFALKSKYPLTDKSVNAVISRQKRKPKEE